MDGAGRRGAQCARSCACPGLLFGIGNIMSLPSLVPVVLCGGSGTRLWPLSRETYPKQFLRLLGKDSLLQQTMKRLNQLAGVEPALLICNESSRFVVAEQLREIGIRNARIV